MRFLKQELDDLRERNLFRLLKVVDGPQEARIVIAGKNRINLCSNNYLGLSNDPRIKKAASVAVKKYGLGSGASRLISGNTSLHQKLEERLTLFKKCEAALVFNSGYCANLAVISSLAGRDDIVFSDRLNHASIIDGITLSGAEFRRYPHKDTEALEALLKKFTDFRRRLIVTDSVFSMDGDLAPLPELARLAKKYECLLYVDEAHATGVLGKHGSGALEYFGIGREDFIIPMGTFSKALGGFGAYVAGSRILIDYLINKARAFIYTTALPASLCAASLVAIDIIENDSFLRNKLNRNIDFFRRGLRKCGFSVPGEPTAIIPLLIGDSLQAMEFSRRLFKEGVFVQAIRPPTVPQGSARLRITIMATHKKNDLEFALEKIAKIARSMGVI